MSFSDVVKGQEKFDVARSFSALLQLVIFLTNKQYRSTRVLKLRTTVAYNRNHFLIFFVMDENWISLVNFQVNNGEVELEKRGVDGESICYTSVNPFHVRLTHHDIRPDKTQHQMLRKQSTSSSKSENGSSDNVRHINHKSSHDNNTLKQSRTRDLSQQNRKLPGKLGKVGSLRTTPEGKRRRRSRFAEPVDLG